MLVLLRRSRCLFDTRCAAGQPEGLYWRLSAQLNSRRETIHVWYCAPFNGCHELAGYWPHARRCVQCSTLFCMMYIILARYVQKSQSEWPIHFVVTPEGHQTRKRSDSFVTDSCYQIHWPSMQSTREAWLCLSQTSTLKACLTCILLKYSISKSYLFQTHSSNNVETNTMDKIEKKVAESYEVWMPQIHEQCRIMLIKREGQAWWQSATAPTTATSTTAATSRSKYFTYLCQSMTDQIQGTSSWEGFCQKDWKCSNFWCWCYSWCRCCQCRLSLSY